MTETVGPGIGDEGTSRLDPTARGGTAAMAVADPAPLGLAGFALTTVMLSALNAGAFGSSGSAGLKNGGLMFIGMALFYGGLAQFLAGMWEFKNRNTFGATAFSSFGAFWMGLGILFVFDVLGRPVVAFTGHIGFVWFLFLWAVFTSYMFIASLRTTAAVALVFLLLALTFWALWVGELRLNPPGHEWTRIGGFLGFATAIAAFYASFANVTNQTWNRVILPVMPLKQE